MAGDEGVKTRGGRLRFLRHSRGLTLASVARLAQITPTSLSLLERDRRTPSRELLFRLAEIFHVSPQLIEAGELTPEDQAKKARHTLWPEIVYFVANHLIVPREMHPLDVAPENDGLLTAIAIAFDAPHFCEFRAWAESSKGRAIAGQFSGAWALEELIERTAGKGTLNLAPLWIDMAGGLDRHRRLSPKHYSAVSDHPSDEHPADCFQFDLDSMYQLYSAFPFVSGHPGRYARDSYRDHVVEAAFGPIFWSAAKQWSDRRMAGWLWYLDMPVDLFGPLARLARQYDSAEDFTANARRLLEQATVEDRDVFLGLFPDILGERVRYIERFGSVQCVGGVVRARPILPAFIPVVNRREDKKTSRCRELISLVSTMGDDDKLKRCEKALLKIAGPVWNTPMGLSVDERKGKGKRKRTLKPAREDDRPPETLP